MLNSTNTMNSQILTLENPAFCSYLLSTSLLILKIMGVPLLTILHRFKNKIFICEEDAQWQKGEVGINPTVERTRRAHLNDLENIPIFLIVSLGYLWTNTPLWLINTLFIIYLSARCLHTIVYTIVILPQPTRATLWFIGYIITGYMAIHTAMHAFISLL